MGISDEWVQDTPDGVSLLIKVIPRAGTSRIGGIREGRLLVRLAAAPVDGAANEALISFLAKRLNVPARNITLAAGGQSRNKLLKVSGVTRAACRSLTDP